MKQLFGRLSTDMFIRAGMYAQKSLRLKESGIPRETIIMHVDIVDSTSLVISDLVSAHEKLQQLYSRIRSVSEKFRGTTRELRGDAAVIEFNNTSDAVSAAQLIQSTNIIANNTRIGNIEPRLRIGISQGSVVFGNNTITGEAVILAQRLEQLAKSGEIIVDSRVKHSLVDSSDFQLEHLGSECLKGFPFATDIYRASFSPTSVLYPCAKF